MSSTSSADDLVDHARELLRKTPWVFISSVAHQADGAHGVSTRLVQPLIIDDDLTMFIGTSPRSRKVAELRAYPTVTIAAEDRPAFAYVTVRGAASIIEDLAERQAAWKEELRPFFPDGPGGDDFVLIRVETTRVEIMDFAAGINPDPFGLLPAVVERRASTWHETPGWRTA